MHALRFHLHPEVFEHSPDPAGSLRQILERASPGDLTIYIGTGIH